MQLPRDELLSTFYDKIDMIRYDLFHDQCMFLKKKKRAADDRGCCTLHLAKVKPLR